MPIIFNRFFKTQRLGFRREVAPSTITCRRPPPAPASEEQNPTLEVILSWFLAIFGFRVYRVYLFLDLGFLLLVGFRVFTCFYILVCLVCAFKDSCMHCIMVTCRFRLGFRSQMYVVSLGFRLHAFETI